MILVLVAVELVFFFFGFCVNGMSTLLCGDFFLAGIMFQDITTLLLDPKAFKDTIDLFVERYKDKNISVVAGQFFVSEFVMRLNCFILKLLV